MMSILNLISVNATEAVILNKKELNGEEIKLTISKKMNCPLSNTYECVCTAEMYKIDEEDMSILDRTFNVTISIKGIFKSKSSEKLEDEFINDETFKQLLPHLRAYVATLMAGAGLAPYLIPDTFIAND